MSGKGDKRRPRQVSREQFEKNWDRLFGNVGNSCPNESCCCDGSCFKEGKDNILDKLTKEAQKLGMYENSRKDNIVCVKFVLDTGLY